MKKTPLSLAILSVVFLAYDVSAQAPRKGPDGQRGTAEKGAGRGPERQGRGGPGAERDPAQMVARLMQEFDKDGDQKLDSTELTALMTSMRDRRGGARPGGEGQGQARQGRPGQARQGQGKPGQGKPGAEGQRRRRGTDEAGKPGGERPKRPADE